MQSPLRALVGRLISVATLTAAGLSAPTAGAAEKVLFTAPSSNPGSSLAPIRPSDLENDLNRVFNRSESKASGVDVGVARTFSPPSAPAFDAKTWSRRLQDLDKKKNWLVNDEPKRAAGEADPATDPFDEAEGHTKSSLERRILGEDSVSKEKSERRHPHRERNEEPGFFEKNEGTDRQDSRGSASKAESTSERNPTRALFSDPLSTAASARDAGESSAWTGGAAELQPRSQAQAAARLERVFGGPATAVLGIQNEVGSVLGYGGSKVGRIQELQNILGGNATMPSGMADILGAASPARAPLASAFSGPGSFGGSSLANPLSPPRTARPTDSYVRPQPSVLPLPTRDF